MGNGFRVRGAEHAANLLGPHASELYPEGVALGAIRSYLVAKGLLTVHHARFGCFRAENRLSFHWAADRGLGRSILRDAHRSGAIAGPCRKCLDGWNMYTAWWIVSRCPVIRSERRPTLPPRRHVDNVGEYKSTDAR
jgi:hypothetical protein